MQIIVLMICIYAHMNLCNWEKARHGESNGIQNMQKHLANIKTIIQREKQKANGAGRETKNKTMETKS